ncbi:MAG TPA: bi-domain-containing oxidoreductase [Pyrinomonadaceae bacterium]|nr:bi-domain-containing oxidoreductase [Pyrinomonadaceae bacterium]
MKQVLQNLRTGHLSVQDVPPPVLQKGRVLVRTGASLISAGTERASLQFARRNLVGKARERPDLVRHVIQKFKTEGLANTVNAVRARLDSTKALGYSAAGTVIGVGAAVSNFSPGDRVCCAGADFASHAEVLSVPQNLCVRLPNAVGFEAGAFGTLGAIALQGVRLAEPTLGEAVVVIGLGLLGQITVQLLKANGCRVFGVDVDAVKVQLACDLGAEAAVTSPNTSAEILDWSRGRGADAVLITAATSSNEPLELAGEVSRRKGRVIAVGLVGLDVPRQPFYERELTLKISMSYGPGRYDPEYEERGHDYPFAYVRWTLQRNMEAFLDLLVGGQINVDRLITHRFSIDEAARAYELLNDDANSSYLGVMLQYSPERELTRDIQLTQPRSTAKEPVKSIELGLIGAGKYTRSVLLPHFKSEGVSFRSINTASGVSAQDVGTKFGFYGATCSADEILDDPKINLIVIGTRHDTHAQLTIGALKNNKDVFVEKPLALNDDELDRVLVAATHSRSRLMVGFNRRFAPLSRKAKEIFSDRRCPLSILYRVNAGRVSKKHWTQDQDEGGGRIIGEVCHFVDLTQFWVGSPPISVYTQAVSGQSEEIVNSDSVFITLKFADGSNACIAYLAEGDKGLPKERVEIFGGGKAFVIDNFRTAILFRNGREEKTGVRTQDKGQREQVRAVCRVVLENSTPPVSLEELAATTRATFRINDSLRFGQPMLVDSVRVP